jgi:hypothetical protein
VALESTKSAPRVQRSNDPLPLPPKMPANTPNPEEEARLQFMTALETRWLQEEGAGTHVQHVVQAIADLLALVLYEPLLSPLVSP